ncbi:diguanylate cyclase [Oceanospirillaceae bacterium ASx5O]|nr:diguanylate cyclase [Oceanospirillaceae bacterium ASx5O]
MSLARLMLILPLLLCLILFATGVPRMAGWVADSGTLLVVVLGAGGALLLVLAQVFNQGRIGHMALLVLASFALQHYGLPAPGVAYSGPAYWLLFWLALLLPLNIVLIRWLPEYRPWSVGALSWPVLLLVQLVLVWAVPRSPLFVDAYSWVQSWQLQAGGGGLPLPAWMSATLAAGILLTRLPRQPDTVLAMLGVLLLQALAFYFAASAGAPLLAALLSLLLLLVALLIHNHQLAFVDELTGISGRRALLNDLRHRHGRYTLVMADIDHFKSFNDTHGHDVGDDVLRLVASQLRLVGGGGKAYRYGGEEFTLVFGSDDLKEVTAEVDRLRESIAVYPLVVRNKAGRPADNRSGKQQRGRQPKDKVLHVTMSFGVALRQPGEESEMLMKRADKALYKAKQNGRNRVERAR